MSDEEGFEDELRRLLKEEVAARLASPGVDQSAGAQTLTAGRRRLNVPWALVAACLLVAVTITAIGLAGQGGPRLHATATATVNGHLKVGVNGGPAPGIHPLSPGNSPVDIWQGSHLVEVVTAKNGEFIAHLRPGRYRLRATTRRWCSWQSVTVKADSSVRTTLYCIEQIR